MYRTIVVGTDGSPTAALARATAIDLAARFGSRLVVATAFDPRGLTEGLVRNVAAQAVAAAEARGVAATSWVQRGPPEDVILGAADAEKADLVVVGNKGMAEGTRFRLGGVPDRVAHHASSDVWIVATTQAAVPALAQARHYRHILVGTDGSPTASEAVRKAFELAAIHDATLTLAHVGDPITGTIHLESAARGGPAGVDVRLAALQGSPAEQICEYAEREAVDLIVVGNKGLSGARRYLIGSVPSSIARAAPSDVLIARTVDLSVFDIEPGHGAVVDLDGRRMAVFRDSDGRIHAVSARCTHLGCTVAWNDGEQTWDCPCHGSRYDRLGHVIRGPAPADLEGAPAAAAKEELAPAPGTGAGRHGDTFVIVGASVAGGSAAVRLREEGFDGRLVLIGAENHYPYERPPLSKTFLRGETPFEESLLRPVDWYREQRVELRLGTSATALDPKERTVTLEGGEVLRYDRCLIATGARNRRPPVPGLDMAGVHQLRTVRDADAIREEIAPGRRAVVVGMGFIGSEVAASLRQKGVEVTTIDGGTVPLGRVLGEEIGGILGEVHREHGVTTHFEQVVAAFEGDTRVRRVVTKDGLSVDCDFAVVGMGVQPNTELAEAAGLNVDNGIVVDELCRAGEEGVFAAGDVANHFHPVFGVHIRTEHWNNAIHQGEAAAVNMLGRTDPYVELPWFWSDQYEHNLQYVGFHTDWDDLVIRGRTEDRRFVAFYVKDGRVQSVLALNQGDAVDDARDLIMAAYPSVSREALADPAVELRDLAPARHGRKAERPS
jgi:3-phenylpropionate/trans-cinnamate dioxygenase ferredoxin reductase component